VPVDVDGRPSRELRKDVKQDISNFRYNSEDGIYEKVS